MKKLLGIFLGLVLSISCFAERKMVQADFIVKNNGSVKNFFVALNEQYDLDDMSFYTDVDGAAFDNILEYRKWDDSCWFAGDYVAYAIWRGDWIFVKVFKIVEGE